MVLLKKGILWGDGMGIAKHIAAGMSNGDARARQRDEVMEALFKIKPTETPKEEAAAGDIGATATGGPFVGNGEELGIRRKKGALSQQLGGRDTLG